MDLEPAVTGGKTKAIVILLVVVGILVIGASVFVVLNRQNGKNAGASEEAEKWCKLRREWGQKVAAIEGDILLKSIRAEDAEAKKKLEAKRDELCAEYAKKLQALKPGDQTIQKIEIELVKEGKSRANLSVEIANELAKYLDSADITKVRASYENLKNKIGTRIKKVRADGEQTRTPLLKALGCKTLYIGPITDRGSSASPYISWKQIAFDHQQALKAMDKRVKELEPLEQYGNHIYHDLISRYRKELKACYMGEKRKKAALSPILKLLVTVKANGRVGKLGMVDGKDGDEKILDCLLKSAGRWKLSPPAKDGDRVMIKLELSRL